MNVNTENSETSKQRSRRLGAFGEDTAAKYLRLRGFRIVARNFSTAIGRNRKGVVLKGEIDLIALDSDSICFIEVKTRSGNSNTPESAVTRRKQQQITRSAQEYMKYFDINGLKPRFDVITVCDEGRKSPAVEHLKAFWSP